MASAAVTERCKKNKNLLEWLDSIILAVAVLSLVFTFAARAIRVDGHSMDPTLHDQQLLIMQGGVHGMPVHTDGPCGKGEHKRKHSNRQNDGIQPFQQVFVLFAALCYSGTCHSQSSPPCLA